MGGGLTTGAQVHWQTGQGERERRGGEEGLGLGQRDPEGDTGGRVDKDRGETGREEEAAASWASKDSLLGEVVREGEVMPGGEKGMGSERLVATEGLRSLGEVSGLRGASVGQDKSEVDPDNVTDEVIGSSWIGVGMGEAGADVGEAGTEVTGE